MNRHHSLAALSLAAALTLSACTSSTPSTDTAGTDAAPPASSGATEAPGSAEASGSTSSDAVSGEHNDADVMFARMMIPHHQQAVEMSETMLSKDGISPEIIDLATKIKDEQGPEIDTMTSWLEAWDEPMAPEGGMGGHGMGDTGSGPESGSMDSMEGMLSEDQMSGLEAAEGTEASRLFLESMTAHHEGAIEMAGIEISDGENPRAIELAETVVETQQAEIDEMDELLSGL